MPNISASAESTLKTMATILLIGGIFAALIFIFGVEDHAIGIGAGCRCFGGGTFSGEEAKLYVYYNAKTKIVYRAKAVIERNSDDKCRKSI